MRFIRLEQIVINRHILSAIISGSRVRTLGRKSESIFRNTFKRLSVFPAHHQIKTWKNNHSFSTRAKETHETSSKYSNLSKIPFHFSSLLGTPFLFPHSSYHKPRGVAWLPWKIPAWSEHHFHPNQSVGRTVFWQELWTWKKVRLGSVGIGCKPHVLAKELMPLNFPLGF